MDMISLQGKTNFFEKRVSDYRKAGVKTDSTAPSASSTNAAGTPVSGSGAATPGKDSGLFSLDEDF